MQKKWRDLTLWERKQIHDLEEAAVLDIMRGFRSAAITNLKKIQGFLEEGQRG